MAFPQRVPQAIMQRLAEIVWHYTFMHYFWMQQERNKSPRAETGGEG
jgi:hypothetical protein